eukprot:scaffold70941_cov46-Prasinocladus_malaysianus.AAC.1
MFTSQGMRELEESVSSWTSARRALQEGTSVEQMIRVELERCYGQGSVVCVNVMASHEDLRRLDRRYKRTKEKVRALIDRYSSGIQRRQERILLEKVRLLSGPTGLRLFPCFVLAVCVNSM